MTDDFSLKDIVREIRQDMKEALERQTRHEVLLEGILKQAEKTNGRVFSLEEKQANTNTRVGVISAGIGLVITPIVTLIMSQIFK